MVEGKLYHSTRRCSMEWNPDEALPMETSSTLQCPWCLEYMDVFFPPDERGTLTQDCEVCCRPWVLTLTRSVRGERMVHIEREN